MAVFGGHAQYLITQKHNKLITSILISSPDSFLVSMNWCIDNFLHPINRTTVTSRFISYRVYSSFKQKLILVEIYQIILCVYVYYIYFFFLLGIQLWMWMICINIIKPIYNGVQRTGKNRSQHTDVVIKTKLQKKININIYWN